jgi:aspartate 1-decarboxylase
VGNINRRRHRLRRAVRTADQIEFDLVQQIDILDTKEFPMLRTFVGGKIHRLKVTGLQPIHNGSCLICPQVLAAAGIEPFEKVEIYSLTSTAHISTYVFPGAEGEFTLNGNNALHFELGDRVAVVAYRHAESFSGATCVMVDPVDNSIVEFQKYEWPDRACPQQPSATLAQRRFRTAALCFE